MKKSTKLFIMLGVFTLVFGITIFGLTAHAEGETEQAVGTVEKAIDWIKNLSMADFKGMMIGAISYLSANLLVFVALAIKLIANKTEQVKQSKYHQELMEKLDEEHKKQMLQLEEKVTAELQEVNKSVIDVIKSQNSEKRKQAQDNVEAMKQKIDEIKVEIEQ